MMGLATACIGLLPAYDSIGVWAPIILVFLRVIQGFGVGGQWGGAVLMAVEHAPPGQRGFYGSWPQIGVPAGLLTSTIIFTAFTKLPQAQLLALHCPIPAIPSHRPVGVRLPTHSSHLCTP